MILQIPMIRRVVLGILASMLCISWSISPILAQSVDPEQPSPINNVLHFWGYEDISDCWDNFDPEGSGGSAEQGYGEEVDGGDAERLEVDITCSMKFNFDENMFLNPGMKIVVEVGLRVDHAEAESEEDEDLMISLMKGGDAIDSRSFPNIDTDEDVQLKWEVDVGENSTWWNSSKGEPGLRFQISKTGWDASGTPCSGALQVLKCGGSFRLYFSNNQDGMRTQVDFPIGEAPEIIVDEEPGDESALPGFELVTGLGAILLAGDAFSRGSRERPLTPPRFLEP